MSTFVFAPSWVTYPNHPKSKNNIWCYFVVFLTYWTTGLKEETDEFPTLISHSKNINTSNKKENNVWSNPSLIQKIHHEEEEEVDYEENKYELERLKALVPKTKKSLSNTSCTSIPRRNIRIKRKIAKPKESLITSKLPPPPLLPSLPTPSLPRLTSLPIPSPASEPSLPEQAIKPLPKYYISEQEQQHFIYFIKAWTSTGIISTNNYNRDYSYFSNISSNSSHTSNSSDTSFQSDSNLYTSNSYFHHDPF